MKLTPPKYNTFIFSAICFTLSIGAMPVLPKISSIIAIIGLAVLLAGNRYRKF